MEEKAEVKIKKRKVAAESRQVLVLLRWKSELLSRPLELLAESARTQADFN